jgi:WD40 repeat protein
MAEAIITRRGGVGFPDGWNESVSAPALGDITKHEPVVLRAFGEWKGEEGKLPDPATLPAGAGYGCAFSPDGTYLAVVHLSLPYITIYKRSGDSFSKLANPSTLPISTGYGCAFSPDGTYLAVAHSTSPYITIYKRSGDSFSKLANPSTLPISTGYGCAFSPDGTYLAVAHNTSPCITIYKRSGDTFTKLADPATLPAGAGYGCAFSPDGTYLSVAHNTSPYITIYNADARYTLEKMTSRNMFLLEGKHGLALNTANNGEMGRAIVFPNIYNLPRE